MSNSFYGGRDGRPMIIKKTFDTVAAMIADTAFGNVDYKEVGFGEYVIIESVNKNNPENGRIFRRDKDINTNRTIEQWSLDGNIYKKTDVSAKGATYITQIVGPSGNAPHLHFQQKESDVITELNKYTAPTYDKKSGEGVFSLGNGNLVSGKEHDTITWKWCSVRNENQQETNAYIGFTIPYTVIEFEADSIAPYNNPKLIDRENTDTKPFYEKWKIHIPKGIKGDSIGELTLNDSTGLITYNIHNFDASADGQSNSHTLNANNPLTWITEASLDTSTGNLKIGTNNNTKEIDEDLTWVKNLTISEDGKLNTYTTTGQNQIKDQPLQWVKEIKFAQDGTITIVDINGNERTGDLENKNPDAYNKLIKWITNVSLDPETGAFKLDYNNGTASLEKSLQWVKDIAFAQDGTITIDYTNKDNDIRNKQLKWIDKINLADDGKFSYGYNTDENATANESTQIKWPTNIQVNTDGTITTTYNNDGIETAQNPTMNWITNVSRPEKTQQLTLDFVNTPSIVADLKTPNKIELENGVIYATYNTSSERVPLGSVENRISACAATTEVEVDPNLNVGGLWFVTEE